MNRPAGEGQDPQLTPQRWLEEFAELPGRDANRQGILKQNAMRVLGLG